MSTSDPTPTPAPVAAPTPGTPEYDAAMAAKFDAAGGGLVNAPAPTPAPTPAPAPAPAPAPTPTPTPTPAPAPTPAPTPSPAPAPTGALDLKAFEAEIAEKGALSEDSLKALESKGVPREFAEAYANNVKAAQALEQATVAKEEAELVGMVGGAEEFSKLAQWAKGSMTPEEVKAFNEVVMNGSLEQAKLALSGVHARYQAAVRTPGFVQGGGAAPGLAYASTAEVTRAMSDPRYSSDAAYRAEVYRRLEATDYATLK